MTDGQTEWLSAIAQSTVVSSVPKTADINVKKLDSFKRDLQTCAVNYEN